MKLNEIKKLLNHWLALSSLRVTARHEAVQSIKFCSLKHDFCIFYALESRKFVVITPLMMWNWLIHFVSLPSAFVLLFLLLLRLKKSINPKTLNNNKAAAITQRTMTTIMKLTSAKYSHEVWLSLFCAKALWNESAAKSNRMKIFFKECVFED